MVNLNALQRVLPISSLQAFQVVFIDGFSNKSKKERSRENITDMEPPAGQHVPYVDARAAMVLLFEYQGMSAEEAKKSADRESFKWCLHGRQKQSLFWDSIT